MQDFQLKVKSTGETKAFNLLSEERFLKDLDNKAAVRRFDMDKLEVEYDYDTESEQINHSKTMLMTDLQDAIDWFIIDDPLNIVQNLNF